jgi:large subunit ribosomal protein L10
MSKHEQIILDKQEKVDSLVNQIEQSDALFFTEYRGLTVTQLDQLRNKLRENGGSYKVIKNSLITRAFNQLKIECPESLAKGPTGLIISTKDCPTIASYLYKYKKDNEDIKVKGGLLDGSFLTESEVKVLSKLPPREVLLGQLVGGLNAIISRFILSISSPLRGVVYSLDAVKNQKMRSEN